VNPIELLATGVHAALSVMHARAATGHLMSGEERGATAALHILSVAYNLTSPVSIVDIVAHLGALGVLRSQSKAGHLLAAVYDAGAAWKHARRISASA
jgi:hypothetical protein